LIAAALDALPADVAELLRRRIRDSASASRPIVCPLLDRDAGACLVYSARPVACRAYGFYAERQFVLGCSRIESIAEESPDVVWGNHAALEEELRLLGPAAELYEWLGSGDRRE
jgi:Fe-S-cluster containining protein